MNVSYIAITPLFPIHLRLQILVRALQQQLACHCYIVLQQPKILLQQHPCTIFSYPCLGFLSRLQLQQLFLPLKYPSTGIFRSGYRAWPELHQSTPVFPLHHQSLHTSSPVWLPLHPFFLGKSTSLVVLPPHQPLRFTLQVCTGQGQPLFIAEHHRSMAIAIPEGVFCRKFLFSVLRKQLSPHS